MRYLLGIDIGSYSSKGVLLDDFYKGGSSGPPSTTR